jgi:hypothetical protein
MALGVVKSGMLTGKSAEQVEALLGSPTHRANSAWRYAIGQCIGFGWHHSDLWVRFGPSGALSDTTIRLAEPNAA